MKRHLALVLLVAVVTSACSGSPDSAGHGAIIPDGVEVIDNGAVGSGELWLDLDGEVRRSSM